MSQFVKNFPEIFKASYIIVGHSAAEVRIAATVKSLGGTFINWGHMFAKKECAENNCREFHCQHWIPPKNATLYQISYKNRDTYYLLLFKNHREVFLEASGGEGCVDIKTLQYDEIKHRLASLGVKETI